MDIRFLGHACFELTDGDTRVLVDPFLSGNPKAAVEPGDVDPTHIFLTHGHPDHYGDVEDVAKRTVPPMFGSETFSTPSSPSSPASSTIATTWAPVRFAMSTTSP